MQLNAQVRPWPLPAGRGGRRAPRLPAPAPPRSLLPASAVPPSLTGTPLPPLPAHLGQGLLLAPGQRGTVPASGEGLGGRTSPPAIPLRARPAGGRAARRSDLPPPAPIARPPGAAPAAHRDSCQGLRSPAAFFRVFTTFFQGFSRALFSPCVFLSGSYCLPR